MNEETKKVMYCYMCGNMLSSGSVFCSKCGTKVVDIFKSSEKSHDEEESSEVQSEKIEEKNDSLVEVNSNEKSLSLEDRILMQKIETMEKEIGKMPKEVEEKPRKRDKTDWWESWICANCGRPNSIEQQKCLACGLDIRSSYTLGKRNGTISAEEEQFYYERIRPHQMQQEILKKQKEQMAYEQSMRRQQEMIFTPKENVSGLAIASMILGIITLVVTFDFTIWSHLWSCLISSLLAMLFSVSPIRDKKRGYGMAIAGLICGLIALLRVLIAWSALRTGYNMFFGD